MPDLPINLPERIRHRLKTLQDEIDSITQCAIQLAPTELPNPIQFEFANSAGRDVLTEDERAQAVSFVTRYDHLPSGCRVNVVEIDGRYEIENMDYLRHALNEFRPIIQNEDDSVHYKKIHRVWYGMLTLEDSDRGTTIRAFDITHRDVTSTCIRWLGETNKAIKYVLGRLEYGYLYNGILQHSDPKHYARLTEDYTSGELNYIMWKHAHMLDFIKDLLGRYHLLIQNLSSLRPGAL
jgi:hypothetical protein